MIWEDWGIVSPFLGTVHSTSWRQHYTTSLYQLVVAAGALRSAALAGTDHRTHHVGSTVGDCDAPILRSTANFYSCFF